MFLAPGTRLGSYEVLSALGAGGMGEVYRATDTKLKRPVAIKILPASVASDHERLARFQREAEVLASLNHPHIAGIYGLEDTGGVKALVMELVEGDDLSQRIARGAMPVDDTLAIAKQIAEALEAAHEQGIIHRDLKPANIKVRADGTVKVLDFGLAKAMEPATGAADAPPRGLSMSPTLSMHATQAGIILGTAAYMSPEQAAGRPVDKRADIWAFGVVLFEMLSGRPAFEGTSTTEVLADVLKSDPAWQALPPSTPPGIRQLLGRCLQKKPGSRLRDIGDARIQIEEWLARPESPHAPPPPHAATRALRWPLAVTAASLVAALGTVAVVMRRPISPAGPARTWEFPLGEYVATNEFIDGPEISPDGRMIAFDGAGLGPLRVRDIDALAARVLPGTEGGDMPFWSPDSEFIGYVVAKRDLSTTVWKVPARGGAPFRICDGPPGALWGAAWLANGDIVLSIAYGPKEAVFFSVSSLGGRPTLLAADSAGKFAGMFPTLIGGDQWLSAGLRRVTLRSAAGPEQTITHDDFSLGAMAYGSGYLLHLNRKGDGVWATQLDPARGVFSGRPVVVAPGGRHPSLSHDGTLVYKSVVRGEQQLAWVDRSGTVVAAIGQAAESFADPALAPDGTRLAVVTREDDVETLWAYDVARGTRTRTGVARSSVTMAGTSAPAWSPGGDRIAVSADWDIVVTRIDSPDKPQVIVGGAPVQMEPTWSPDGRTVMFSVWENGNTDLWFTTVDPSSTPQKFLATAADESGARFAPDGRHVAYVSTESGRSEIFVREFPGGQRAHQVSVNGGERPHWSPRGDELFFVANDTLMGAAIQRGADSDLSFAVPQPLFTAAKIGADAIDYDVAKDGKRFVVVRTLTRRERRAVVVENWVSRLPKR